MATYKIQRKKSNGTLEDIQIPVSSVAGAVDTTTNQTIGGTKTFETRPNVNIAVLPNEYQQVEYIEATGTQYIAPNVVTPTNVYWYVKFAATQLKGEAGNGYNLIVGLNSNPQMAVYADGWTVGNRGSALPFEPVVNVIYEATLNQFGNGKYYVNNYDIGISRTGSCSPNIFNPSSQYGGSNARIYSVKFKMVGTNEVINNFVPCYRKSDDVIGLYDTCTGVFHTNAGTGEFIKGSNITVTEVVIAIDLATVATSGSYNDLTNKPTIPSNYVIAGGTKTTSATTQINSSVPNTFTLKRTQSNGGVFIDYKYANQDTNYARVGAFSNGDFGVCNDSQDAVSLKITRDRTIKKDNTYEYTLPDATGTIALTSNLPTKTSDITNDSGYITSEDIPTFASDTDYTNYINF